MSEENSSAAAIARDQIASAFDVTDSCKQLPIANEGEAGQNAQPSHPEPPQAEKEESPSTTVAVRQEVTAPRPKRQISDKQLAANRRNAQLSTGPKSKQGKENVRNNARKHGVFASRIGDDPAGAEASADYEYWRDQLYAHCGPVGPLEGMVVEQLAYLRYRLAKLALHDDAVVAARLVQVETSERMRMGREWQAVLDSLGSPLTYENLTSCSRGVEHLLDLLAEMDATVAAGCASMPLEPHDVHVYLSPGSSVAKLMLDVIAVETRVERSPDNQVVLANCRHALRSAIAAQKGMLEPLRDRLLKEEQARLEAEKARCYIPDPAAAELSLRYLTSTYREMERLINQLERLQACRRGETVPQSPRALRKQK
jgi:hypothetical protein